MIRLMIVDDQKILLEGLKKIFEGQRHIEVVSTLPFSELVEPACQKIRPDVILMDICMEGKNSGIALTQRLKKKYPENHHHDRVPGYEFHRNGPRRRGGQFYL